MMTPDFTKIKLDLEENKVSKLEWEKKFESVTVKSI